MAEGAFDEADIEAIHDNFGGLSNRMTPVDAPLHTLKPHHQDVPQQLDRGQFR